MKILPVLMLLALLGPGCRKVFVPDLGKAGDNRYLVVEGSITGTDSTVIRLSRTKQVDTSRVIIAEPNAVLTVEDDANGAIPLAEIRPGTYAAALFNLDASRKYRLRIKTAGGREYLSDYVAVKNSPPIDSVGFKALPSKVQVYVSTHDAANSTRYYRWDYSETWQFHTMYRSGWASYGQRHVDDSIYYCFQRDSSSTVTIASTTKLSTDIVYQFPVTTVDPASEKIEEKYSVLVKQYALTPDAYAFWENLQKNTQNIGSVFDVLPSSAPTNYRCLSNPGELVVGYLSAGNAAYKRVFITKAQLPASYVTVYPAVCELDTAFLVNPPKTPQEIAMTDEFSHNSSAYTPVMGLYLPPPNPFGGPTAMSFSTVFCVDCTIRGVRPAPAFWR
jgi:hypothetical protein